MTTISFLILLSIILFLFDVNVRESIVDGRLSFLSEAIQLISIVIIKIQSKQTIKIYFLNVRFLFISLKF